MGRPNVLRGNASNKANLILGTVLVTITKSLSNPNPTGSIYLISIYFHHSLRVKVRMPAAVKSGANEGVGGGPAGIKRPTAVMDIVIQIEVDFI